MVYFLIPTLLRWVSVPLAIAVLASTVISFVAGPWWIVAALLGTASLIGWTVVLLASTILAAIRQNWERAVLLPFAFVCSLPLIALGVFSGDYVHLVAMYPYYSFKIHSLPDWQSKEVRFDWGDDAVTALDGLLGRVLIYDASGKAVVGDQPDLGGGEVKVTRRRLIGNFYLELWSSR
jgi:hypothetical protein